MNPEFPLKLSTLTPQNLYLRDHKPFPSRNAPTVTSGISVCAEEH